MRAWDDPRSDAELLRATRSDGDAFRVLFERHSTRVEHWFARQSGDRDVALDLTAETFARALERAGRFRPLVGDSALPWLFGIGANVLHVYWREQRLDRSARQRLRIADELRFADGPEARDASLPDSRITSTALHEALGGLSEPLRRAVILRVVQELPYPALAAELGCTPENARLRVSRALRALRALTTRSSQHVDPRP